MIVAISGRIGSGKDTIGKIMQIIIDSPHLNTRGVEAFLKDEVVQPSWKIKKFADKLKDMVCLLIGCTRAQLEDQVFKETELGEEWWYYQIGNNFNGDLSELYSYLEWKDIETPTLNYAFLPIKKLTPRLLLQLLGTDCGRKIIHPNVWVNALMSEYVKSPKANRLFHRSELYEMDNDLHFTDEYPNWIITDMRFPNEMQAVKDKEGITIRVNRTYSKEDLLKSSSPANMDVELSDKLKARYQNMEDLPVVKLHESETALDNAGFDYILDNNCGMLQLIELVREILIEQKII